MAKEAEKLVSFVKSEVKVDNRKETLATKEDVANAKAHIIKGMFIFWIGQIGIPVGLLFAFTIHKY